MFLDVLLPQMERHSRFGFDSGARSQLQRFKHALLDLRALVRTYDAYQLQLRLRHQSPRGGDGTGDTPPSGTEDPSLHLQNLIRIHSIIYDLRTFADSSANIEWRDIVAEQLRRDERYSSIVLSDSLTQQLGLYNSFAGTWNDSRSDEAPLVAYSAIASRHGVAYSITEVPDLERLQRQLGEFVSETVTTIKPSQLAVPFTSVYLDRQTVLLFMPAAVLLLYHYIVAYLRIVELLSREIGARWGSGLAVISRQYAPASVIYHADSGADDLGGTTGAARRILSRAVRWMIYILPGVMIGTVSISTVYQAKGVRVTAAGGITCALALAMYVLNARALRQIVSRLAAPMSTVNETGAENAKDVSDRSMPGANRAGGVQQQGTDGSVAAGHGDQHTTRVADGDR